MYKAYYSREACEMDLWARQERDRLKASQIFKVAQSLEQRYRENHKNDVDDPYTRPIAPIPMPK